MFNRDVIDGWPANRAAMFPFRCLSRRVLLWRLTLITFAFFLILNAVYFYTERRDRKVDSQSYAVIEELIKSKGT